jgi:hypothetical protein
MADEEPYGRFAFWVKLILKQAFLLQAANEGSSTSLKTSEAAESKKAPPGLPGSARAVPQGRNGGQRATARRVGMTLHYITTEELDQSVISRESRGTVTDAVNHAVNGSRQSARWFSDPKYNGWRLLPLLIAMVGRRVRSCCGMDQPVTL